MPAYAEPLYRLQKKDALRAGEALADAFREDPVWNAIFEGEPRREARLGAFETPVLYCLKYGEVYAPSERLEGVAAWVPGRLAERTVWRMVLSGAMRAGMKMGAATARKMEPVFAPLSRDRQRIMGDRPFLYLLIIGVAPAHQGQGFGGQLLRALIAKSEQARQPIYLETETERNVRMYEHFGFRVANQITLPGIGLPMWEMVREVGACG